MAACSSSSGTLFKFCDWVVEQIFGPDERREASNSTQAQGAEVRKDRQPAKHLIAAGCLLARLLIFNNESLLNDLRP
jgi:hypothetical protein